MTQSQDGARARKGGEMDEEAEMDTEEMASTGARKKEGSEER